MKVNILDMILILLVTLSSFSVESSIVSKYSRTSRMPRGSCKKADFVMEKFTHGVCKHGGLDLFLYDITAGQCIEECRARTKCTSINMFLRVNWCRINFEENLVLNKKCPNYHYSSKADWVQKSKVGCESLNCSIKEKCLEKDGMHACVITECMNIPHLENGMVFGNNVKPGQTQAFMCNQGYEIKGEYVITCQADGTWSPDIPTCIEKRKAADSPTVDEQSTPSSYKSSDVAASSSFTPPTTETTTTRTLETTSTSSSSKSVDVTASSSFTPPTKTTTTNTLETATATITAAPKTTSLATAEPTSQALTVGTTTVSSTTSTVAVTTQTQSTSEVRSEDVSSKAATSEVICDDNRGVLSTENCKQSTPSCPFSTVYDPGKDDCVTHCPSLLGTTYQVYQNHSLDPERYSLTSTEYNYNYSVCLDDCLTDGRCAAIVIESALIKGASGYACLFWQYYSVYSSSQAIYEHAGMVYLRNCGFDQQSTGKYKSPMQCRVVGELYSYSENACTSICIQGVQNTFQYLIDTGINESADALVLVEVEETVSTTQCLTLCNEDPRCKLLQVRRSGQGYECDIYGPTFRYSPILVSYTGRDVFLRDCD